VTASRTGQLESAALLASYGADLEVRDGQVSMGGASLKGYLHYLSLRVASDRRQRIGLFLILLRDVARQKATQFHSSCK
jgi:hypothetical protein